METIIQNKILFPEILWERPVHFYKAQAGKVLILAGSKGITGTAILTCEAAFRSGTGILTLGFPETLKDVYKGILPDAMTLALPATPSGSLAKSTEGQIIEQSKSCDAAIIGPGLSTNGETIHLVWQLLFELEIPIVLDADGIIALIKGIEVMRAKEDVGFIKDYFAKLRAPIIITPHPGEAARIIFAIKPEGFKKFSSAFIEKHKKEAALQISENLGVITVLKGDDTAIVSLENPERVEPFQYTPEHNSTLKGLDPFNFDRVAIINKSGSSGQSTGDVLSGIIGSFVAQNPDKILEATATAVYLHGLSEKIAKEKVGERSVTASDIIRHLPEAIKQSETQDLN